jgi:hypothetical protein
MLTLIVAPSTFGSRFWRKRLVPNAVTEVNRPVHPTLKKKLVRSQLLLSSQFGFDAPVARYSLHNLPQYLSDLRHFREGYDGQLVLRPCLYDRFAKGGVTKSEYFWQYLLVDRWVFEANPKKHVDVGSRVDGFVAHVASYREIEVLDIRPITTQLPGVKFLQSDLMNPIPEMEGYCDSLSCLHALEHFGLGRYGDSIDPKGFERGIVNMAKLLRASGRFYLSVPIGVHRVEFNANRVFDPRLILSIARQNRLNCETLTVVRDGAVQTVFPAGDSALNRLANDDYSLGIFTFSKSL